MKDPLFLLDIGQTMKNICFISLRIYILVRHENTDINNAIYTEEKNLEIQMFMPRHICTEQQLMKKEVIDLKENKNMYIGQF